MNFLEKLKQRAQKVNSLLCIGLDPDRSKMPPHLQDSLFEFSRQIIEITANYACAFKLQIAYYSGQNAEYELIKTIDYIKETHPDLPVLLDAKRGDIGTTSEMYAKEVFEHYKADAVTLNPYMGQDSLQPFLKYKNKGCFLLCRTSNPGGADFQDLLCEGRPLYQHIARTALKTWNKNKNILFVIGATEPEALHQVRTLAPKTWFLVPGVGAQGGCLKETLKCGLDSDKLGLLINSSRGILYAGQGQDFSKAAAEAAKSLRDQINILRETLC